LALARQAAVFTKTRRSAGSWGHTVGDGQAPAAACDRAALRHRLEYMGEEPHSHSADCYARWVGVA
jgi:hypothetical protein